MKTIIVEDDPIAGALLRDYCEKIDQVSLIDHFLNSKDALKYTSKNPVDLVLLDIELPDFNGFELAAQMNNHCKVIVTTSKPEYAFEAYKINAIDFLKKPISFPDFEQAIEKVEKNNLPSQESVGTINSIYIKEKGKYVRISLDDILYFENVRDYVCIKTTEKSYAIVSTLKQIVPKLPPSRFLKVHRSYIVNMDKIKDIDDTSLIISGKVIPVSRVNRPILLRKIYCL